MRANWLKLKRAAALITQRVRRCSRAGAAHKILEAASLAQRYDVALMLFALPHVLFAAITAFDAAPGSDKLAATLFEEAEEPADGGDASLIVCGARARRAVVAEIAAVAARCCAAARGRAVGGAAPAPDAALHLQAIVSALDALTECVPRSSPPPLAE